MSDLKTELPCGCYSEIATSEVPAFDPVSGAAILNPDGSFGTKLLEDVHEHNCPEHAAVLGERMQRVQKALADGVPAEEAAKLLVGATPFLLATDDPLVQRLLGDTSAFDQPAEKPPAA